MKGITECAKIDDGWGKSREIRIKEYFKQLKTNIVTEQFDNTNFTSSQIGNRTEKNSSNDRNNSSCSSSINKLNSINSA